MTRLTTLLKKLLMVLLRTLLTTLSRILLRTLMTTLLQKLIEDAINNAIDDALDYALYDAIVSASVYATRLLRTLTTTRLLRTPFLCYLLFLCFFQPPSPFHIILISFCMIHNLINPFKCIKACDLRKLISWINLLHSNTQYSIILYTCRSFRMFETCQRIANYA